MEVSRERLEQLLRLARNAETYEESRRYATAAMELRVVLDELDRFRPRWNWHPTEFELPPTYRPYRRFTKTDVEGVFYPVAGWTLDG